MGARLNGRVAVVTGAGRGIGKQISLALAREGARIVVNDLPDGVRPSEFAVIDCGDADQTVREIRAQGGEAVAFRCSVADYEATEALVQTAVEEFGTLHILVNNAGILTLGTPWALSEKEWDETCNVCLKGAWNCIRHASGLMKLQSWGRIINCSSISALGTAGTVAYGAAKAGMIGLTACAAWDLRAHGVTCNAILPQARQSTLNGRCRIRRCFAAGWNRARSAGPSTNPCATGRMQRPWLPLPCTWRRWRLRQSPARRSLFGEDPSPGSTGQSRGRRSPSPDIPMKESGRSTS